MTTGKRIVLATFGSLGDIHPYMAIAMELQRRGHRPVIATSGLYREKIEGAGLEIFPIRPNIPPPREQELGFAEKIMAPKTGAKFLLHELLFPALRDSYSDLLEAVKDADLLITHPVTFAGPLVARKTGMPWVSSVLAPMSFFSAYDPPVPPFWQWTRHVKFLGPRFVRRYLDFLKGLYRAQPVEALRIELGLPDHGSPVFEGQHSPTLVLALFSALFAPLQPDWPSQTRVTGFAFYDGRHETGMPIKLARFIDDGLPPIVFTLGSSAVWVARDFFQQSITATKALGQRAVLLLGDERNRPAEPLPPEIIAVDYAPFAALLPRACVVVHHGGVGTTSQGLLAGVPNLIVPFAFDQPDNAAHVERLGTSRTLARHRYVSRRVQRELELLLSRAEYAQRAREVAGLLRREDGASRASDLIERVLLSHVSLSENEELCFS
jgi:rhamnosyltransferase subunit B